MDHQTDYPEIMSDKNLYKMADDMTDEIEKENPSWAISRVMDEAGKRTREWATNMRGGEPMVLPSANPNTPPVQHNSTQENNRQTRKANLVRVPTAAASGGHVEADNSDNQEQTPQEAFADILASRGQAS